MRPTIIAKLNRMAAIIREKKAIPIGELGAIMNLAPSTMYGYASYMTYLFLDIKYENGMFTAIGDQKVEDLTAQRRLPA